MKKVLLSNLKMLLIATLLFSGESIVFAKGNIPMHIIRDDAAGNNSTKAPTRPWFITQDDYALTLPALSEDYTLELLDKDGDIVYTAYLPEGTTVVTLPSTLTGDFELRLEPATATYYYRGYIEL